ncbi:flagellar basal-body rod protein; FlgB [Oceanicola granulosus HTCC2516]|uniref:Flagellar basal-body rod protein FlgB n=1 Tax=Oceanicola granulosus (strain ATCC BAA-861 / DSM 15982 / KCTC 12143 / HTCC2516) TaxID=314256 RepID=Q2CDH1_OCEGH|nr:FlgB family protein [Oceanicola granulosus]EAR50740.1 flagellar basal-body rod protein; FlgB [Oceanicola granulosus HTCC2516]
MFDKLDVMQTSAAMARHASARQVLVARNIANADTPGYRAQSLPPFREVAGTGRALAQTRAGHFGGSGRAPPGAAAAEPAPNGNSVSLEQQMVAAAEVQREHSRALTVYKHALDVLRLSVGGR